MNIYIYIYRDGKYLFDRTVGDEGYAERRVEELKALGHKATYLINHLIKDAFY